MSGEGESQVGANALGDSHSITILSGSSFCRSDRNGDISPHKADGLFINDTRLLSLWELTVDGGLLESLGVAADEPYEVTFVTRASHRVAHAEPTVVIERTRCLDEGLHEDITVHNYGSEPASLLLELAVDADFADLFDVKERRPTTVGPTHHQIHGDCLQITLRHDGRQHGLRIRAHDVSIASRALSWQIVVGPQTRWRTGISVDLIDEDNRGPVNFEAGPRHGDRRMRDWRKTTARADCDSPALQDILERSSEDLGSLRISDPSKPNFDVVAAGAPWFMALFGRDSLLTSWLTLPWNPGLARGTLHALARLQGTKSEARSEEEPGRILHEVRLGIDPARALGASPIYYGTVDATPLFVLLLGEATRWGLSDEDVDILLPAADRCLEWISRCGDLDGDGFVEYERKTDLGLINQGWKDSSDSIKFADGHLAHGPIALAEVQGYVHGAYRARAYLASRQGDEPGVLRWTEQANKLRKQFDEAFWLPNAGCYALALDGEKRPVDALASNQGHCLWTGIVPQHRVDEVVHRLLSPEMFAGWGIRTLADGMAAFNPVSYHNGSIWPHDNALLVAGLMRSGRPDAATRVAEGLMKAAALFGGRLPELFCGFDQETFASPVPYPTSCSPQAWAAATPIGLVLALLGLDPDRENLDCHTPDHWGRIRIRGLHMRGKRIDIDSSAGTITEASLQP